MRYLVFSLAALLLHSGAAWAGNTTNVHSAAEFVAASSVGNEQHFDFGTVDSPLAPVGGDQALLGTDGTVTYAGGFSGAGTGTAGGVEVLSGVNGQPIDIFCETEATMTNGAGTGSIKMVAIEAKPGNALGAYGTGGACNGLTGAAAASFILNIGTLDTFALGGKLDGGTTSGFVGNTTYSTTNPNGAAVRVNIFHQ